MEVDYLKYILEYLYGLGNKLSLRSIFCDHFILRWLFRKNVNKKRSILIGGRHLNVSGVIIANYDKLIRLHSLYSHAVKLLDLRIARCFEYNQTKSSTNELMVISYSVLLFEVITQWSFSSTIIYINNWIHQFKFLFD